MGSRLEQFSKRKSHPGTGARRAAAPQPANGTRRRRGRRSAILAGRRPTTPKQRAARSADEAALHRETESKRKRLARELGSSASLEDVTLQLHAEFECVDDLPPLDAEFASLDDF